jgi:hypothetical protein
MDSAQTLSESAASAVERKLLLHTLQWNRSAENSFETLRDKLLHTSARDVYQLQMSADDTGSASQDSIEVLLEALSRGDPLPTPAGAAGARPLYNVTGDDACVPERRPRHSLARRQPQQRSPPPLSAEQQRQLEYCRQLESNNAAHRRAHLFAVHAAAAASAVVNEMHDTHIVASDSESSISHGTLLNAEFRPLVTPSPKSDDDDDDDDDDRNDDRAADDAHDRDQHVHLVDNHAAAADDAPQPAHHRRPSHHQHRRRQQQ